ncbi:hypothetical protein [Chengkuizengella marina]|uniref:Uncharacterized protein n=1 Tax=Chengkuizengella marina TaxID=2507566 RepID=A0A6N9Q8A7_9BACL|nr:hypothetical protein [Chengkuizengella marina]NBI30893.1 hypothetical protein [Chengkuizengella marina]
MRYIVLVFQNLLLAFGIACINKYFSLKRYYELFEIQFNGGPVYFDGGGIGAEFLGFFIDDDGWLWTDLMNVANTFLVIGIVVILISIGTLIFSFIYGEFKSKFRVLVTQNILFTFGILFIEKFVSLKYSYDLYVFMKNLPISNLENSEEITLFGLTLIDGVNRENLMGYANTFLFLSVIFMVLSYGIVVRKSRLKKT